MGCYRTTQKEAFNSTHWSLEVFAASLELGIFREGNRKTAFQAARRGCKNCRGIQKPSRWGGVIGVDRTGAWDRKIGQDHMACSAVDK